MTTLRRRMTEDMQLRGFHSASLRDFVAPRTQEAYLHAVVQLVKYCRSVAFGLIFSTCGATIASNTAARRSPSASRLLEFPR